MSEPVVTEPTVLRISVSTALIMALFTVIFTALMAGTYLATRDTIARSAEAQKLVLINEVLDPKSYDNNLLKDVLTLGPMPELGLPRGGQIWRARKNGQAVGLVIETTAPDGYAGKISLIVGMLADGRVSGVRVTEHRETPGLGDYIDPAKDKNKTTPWIAQFAGLSPATLPLAKWALKKDGGELSYRAGATISARAVTAAVARAVSYVHTHHPQLYAEGNTP